MSFSSVSGRPTMKDVARLAGVAQSTVSLVVNGDERVAPETRINVQKAIEKLGFRVNRAASDLRRVRNQSIGLVTNLMSGSGFPGQLVLGAQEAAFRSNHTVLVLDAGEGTGLSEDAIQYLVEHDVGGLIYAPMTPSWTALPQKLRNVPSVHINNDIVRIEEFAQVSAGDVEGGQIAARALTDAGHRRILFINGAPRNQIVKMRERGFRDVLSEFPIGTFDLKIIYAGSEIRSGYEAMKSVLDAGQWMPTAIFANSDKSALGAVQALAEKGLKVPEDLSIIAYESQTQLSALAQPAISCVVTPYHEMGKMAVDLLLEDPEHQMDSIVRHARPRLVARESVRTIPSGT